MSSRETYSKEGGKMERKMIREFERKQKAKFKETHGWYVLKINYTKKNPRKERKILDKHFDKERSEKSDEKEHFIFIKEKTKQSLKKMTENHCITFISNRFIFFYD